MINKKSLLDAYVSLGSSGISHMGLLIGLIFAIKSPSELDDSNEFKSDCEDIFWMGILTHSLSVLLSLTMPFHACKSLAITQVLSIAVVLSNLSLIMISLSLFLKL